MRTLKFNVNYTEKISISSSGINYYISKPIPFPLYDLIKNNFKEVIDYLGLEEFSEYLKEIKDYDTSREIVKGKGSPEERGEIANASYVPRYKRKLYIQVSHKDLSKYDDIQFIVEKIKYLNLSLQKIFLEQKLNILKKRACAKNMSTLGISEYSNVSVSYGGGAIPKLTVIEPKPISMKKIEKLSI